MKTPLRLHRKVIGIVLILVRTWLAFLKTMVTVAIPAWGGAARHTTRLIVVGGLVTGTGLAIASQTGPWAAGLTDPARTGLFLLCLALGWFLIVLVTRLATPQTLWWPLLPGMAMAANGAAFWISGGRVQAATSLIWPALLMMAGLYLIIRWNRTK